MCSSLKLHVFIQLTTDALSYYMIITSTKTGLKAS